MTNYERKVLARKEAAKREKRKSILTIVAAVAIIACLAALIVAVPLMKRAKLNKPYFSINNEKVTELEFNFHRINLINSNSSILQYMGVTDVETAVYDEAAGTTWGDFFTERAAHSILENRALIADAKAKNIPLDVDTEYKAYMEEIKATAKAAGMDTDAYLTALFGAKEKDLKKIIKDSVTATLYSEYLSEQNTTSDEEAQAEYDAKKNDYDSVDYRVLEFAAEVEEDFTEEETKAAMDAAKAKAQEMLDKVNAGEDFETLCATYAPEERRTDYADSETDYSLVTGATLPSIYQGYGDWLFDEARKAGDAAIHTDEANNLHYVLLFEKRYMGEDVMDTIKQNLTYNKVTEYISKISESYTISDPDDNLPTL